MKSKDKITKILHAILTICILSLGSFFYYYHISPLLFFKALYQFIGGWQALLVICMMAMVVTAVGIYSYRQDIKKIESANKKV